LEISDDGFRIKNVFDGEEIEFLPLGRIKRWINDDKLFVLTFHGVGDLEDTDYKFVTARQAKDMREYVDNMIYRMLKQQKQERGGSPVDTELA